MVTLKNFRFKEEISSIVFFVREIVLFKESPPSQQRFYGVSTELVALKGRNYHLLNILLEADYIVDFVINC